MFLLDRQCFTLSLILISNFDGDLLRARCLPSICFLLHHLTPTSTVILSYSNVPPLIFHNIPRFSICFPLYFMVCHHYSTFFSPPFFHHHRIHRYSTYLPAVFRHLLLSVHHPSTSIPYISSHLLPLFNGILPYVIIICLLYHNLSSSLIGILSSFTPSTCIFTYFYYFTPVSRCTPLSSSVMPRFLQKSIVVC